MSLLNILPLIASNQVFSPSFLNSFVVFFPFVVPGPHDQSSAHGTDDRRTGVTVQLHQRSSRPLQRPQHLIGQKARETTSVVLPVSPLLQQGPFHQRLSTGEPIYNSTRKSSCVNARGIPPARGRKMLTPPPPPSAGPDPPPPPQGVD